MNIIQKFLGYLKLSDEDDEIDDYDLYEREEDERQERRERSSRQKSREQGRAEKPSRKKSPLREDPVVENEEDISVSRINPRERDDNDSYYNTPGSRRDTPSYHGEDSRGNGYGGNSRMNRGGYGPQNAGMAGASQRSQNRGTRMERTTSNKVVPIRTTARGMEVCIIKPTTFEEAQDVCDMLLNNRAVILNLESLEQTDAQRIIDFVCGCVYAIDGKLHPVSRYIFIFSPSIIDISGDFAEFFQEAGFGVPRFNKDF